MVLSGIEALAFDVFGTVVDWRTSVAREAELVLAPKGHRLDWPRFAERWRARYQPAMERVRRGERPWANLDSLHRENLLDLLREFAVEDLSQAEIDHLNRAWHRLDPWPDVLAGLNRLRQRYVLATLSNGNIALMVNMAKRAGLPWDAILGAEIAMSYKPCPDAYRISADRLGRRPEQCLMVAAHNGDLVAAAAVGFRTAFVARPTEHGPGQTADLKAEHPFDVVCDSFIALADRLGC